MKSEAWIFVICTVCLIIITPAYWLLAHDWTGTSALVMTTLLTLMVSVYLGFSANRLGPRPEDRKDADIADGAGELGFFPPYSWWPLWCALTAALIATGVVIGWWLVVIGAILGLIAVSGLIYEYYRGVHAH